MITQPWGFRVYGDPAPKGSLKCLGERGKIKHQLVEDNPHTKAWRTAVDAAARLHVPEQSDPRQPLEIETTFTLARPASHYGTGRNTGRVRPSAPVWPATHGTGDTDKLVRTVLDALEDAQLLSNDAQVVRLTASKHYPFTAGRNDHPDQLMRPGVVIRIYTLEG